MVSQASTILVYLFNFKNLSLFVEGFEKPFFVNLLIPIKNDIFAYVMAEYEEPKARAGVDEKLREICAREEEVRAVAR